MTRNVYFKIIAKAYKEFPKFTVVSKEDSLLMKAIDLVLKVITFGQMKTFMTGGAMTIGYTMYVSTLWNTMSVSYRGRVLLHEMVHMRQAKKYTRPLFYFLYLFVPIPIFFAYFRMKFEMEAYEETLRAVAERHGSTVLLDPAMRSRIIKHFTGSQYFWMWIGRKRIEKWYDGRVAALRLTMDLRLH